MAQAGAGVDVSVGDYVLAIDGRELTGSDNPYRLLQNLEDAVVLTVNSQPDLDGAREVTFVPRGSESSLLYLDWVLGNMDSSLDTGLTSLKARLSGRRDSPRITLRIFFLMNP